MVVIDSARMKRLVLLLALVVSSPAISQSTVPVESDAVISNQLTSRQVQALAGLVLAFGYRCDSISSATPWIFSHGFTLYCNRYRYEYEISEPGGRWQVIPK